jgi:hypothetical protein
MALFFGLYESSEGPFGVISSFTKETVTLKAEH